MVIDVFIAVERDAVEQRAHVAQVADGHAHLAHLAAGQLVVGVVAGLRRQVEGDGEAGLALGEVPAVERVGLGGRRVARVGAEEPGVVALHRPRRRGLRPASARSWRSLLGSHARDGSKVAEAARSATFTGQQRPPLTFSGVLNEWLTAKVYAPYAALQKIACAAPKTVGRYARWMGRLPWRDDRHASNQGRVSRDCRAPEGCSSGRRSAVVASTPQEGPLRDRRDPAARPRAGQDVRLGDPPRAARRRPTRPCRSRWCPPGSSTATTCWSS